MVASAATTRSRRSLARPNPRASPRSAASVQPRTSLGILLVVVWCAASRPMVAEAATQTGNPTLQAPPSLSAAKEASHPFTTIHNMGAPATNYNLHMASTNSSGFHLVSQQQDSAGGGGSTHRTCSNSNNIPQCNCTSNDPCTCTEEVAYICYDFKFQGKSTYAIDVGVTDMLVMVWFYKTDIEKMKIYCSLTIGGTSFDNMKQLRDTTFLYISTDERIVVYQNPTEEPDCFMMIYYAAIKPEVTYDYITELSGELDFRLEPPGPLGYRPQQWKQWIFSYPPEYSITFTVSSLQVGYRDADIHWYETCYDTSSNDMLIVGLGDELMDRTDIVLYGGLEEHEHKSIVINYPVAHVVFYGSYHEQYASGFTLNYTAKKGDAPSTTTEGPTTLLPVTNIMPSTLAILQDSVKSNNRTPALLPFMFAVAGMATEFVFTADLDLAGFQNISYTDVVVWNVSSCIGACYSDTCAAFNFSIEKLTSALDEWAFSSDTLEQMIRDEDLQEYWSYLGEDCQLCEEDVAVRWMIAGAVAVGIVLLAILISVVAWKLVKKTEATRRKESCEAEQKQCELEKRRTSSNASSKIGGVEKGYSKISFPFRQPRDSIITVNDDLEDEIDESCTFPEYDPNFGYDDFGLGTDLLDDPMASNFYANEAFEPDSPRTKVMYPQLQQKFKFDDKQQDCTSRSPPGTPSQMELKRSPLKSSLKRRNEAVVGVATQDISYKPALKSNLKNRSVSRIQEEDSGDDSDDGAVTFQHPSIKRKTFAVRADVHSEESTESQL